jgi:Rrf2 family protein
MSKIVNISEAVSIAIHSMVLIAKQNGQINVNELTKITGSSKNHTAKILQSLVKFGLISSNRGPTGGFTIKKEPKTITLYSIYEMIEGKIELQRCSYHGDLCPFKQCVFGGMAERFSIDFKDYLNKTKISDLI